MRESKSLRTLRSKTYFLDTYGTRRRLVSYLENIHYQADSGLEEIDMNISDGKIHKCDYDIELLEGKVGYKGTDPKGKKIELELLDVVHNPPEIDGNVAIYKNVSKDTDLQLIFLPDKIKVLRILKSNKAPLIARFRSNREVGAAGKLAHMGVDGKERRTKLTIDELDISETEKTITQIFDNKVIKTDPKTRKREWSEDITYPVVIDPTSTFLISPNADDGYAKGGAYTWSTGIYTYDSGIFNTNNNVPIAQSLVPGSETGSYLQWYAVGWTRFTVAGIAQSTTIISATLELYGGVQSWGNAPMSVTIRAEDASDPPNPTNNTTCIQHESRSIGYSTYNTWSNTPVATNNTSGYLDNSDNITSMVQALVNGYDYSTPKHMLFYQKAFRRDSQNNARLYHRNWGATKAPKLIINYLGAGWAHKINGVAAANMAKVNTVAKANIAKINQT
jgi:hypothetical protein